MTTTDESYSFKFEEILAKHNGPKKKNPFPVGKKFVSDVQRRLAYGLDVTNRSINSTVESENATMEEDSWLDMDRGSNNRLELYRRRKSMNRKFLKSMGGYFNQFTMAAPKFDPKIIDFASCSEDSEEDEEPAKKVPEKKEETEQMSGSQGRIGQGCSTPRHMNRDNIAVLNQIDVSAVSFNSTSATAAIPPAPISNNIVEIAEIEPEKDSILENLETFKKKPMPKKNSLPPPLKEKSPVKLQEKDAETSTGTFTIQKDGGTFTVEQEEPSKTRKSLSQALAKTFGETADHRLTNQIVHPVIEVKIARKSETGKRSTLSQGDKDAFNKRQSVQFATIPSPAGKSFGFSDSHQLKKSRVLAVTPGRYAPVKSPEEKTIDMEMNNQTSYMDAETFYPNQETPKSTRRSKVSFAPIAHSKPVIEEKGEDNRRSHALPPRVEQSPRYARPTIASSLKSPKGVPSDCSHNYRAYNNVSNTTHGSNYSDVSSTFVECNPAEAFGEAQLQSGYRPRRDVKDSIQSRLRTINAGLDDDKERMETMEERRKNFLAKRVERLAALSSSPAPIPPTPKVIPEKSTMEVLEQHIDQVLQATIMKEKSIVEQPQEQPNQSLPAENNTAIDYQTIQEEIDAEFDRVTAELQELPLPSTPSRQQSHFDDDFGADHYENDADSTQEAVIIRKNLKKISVNDSIFSANADMTPPGGFNKKKRFEMNFDDTMNSVIEDRHHQFMLKPRKLIRPKTPEDDNVRRSQRVRIPPLRTWMGEKAVYATTPGGSECLVGARKVVVKDRRYVKAMTTDPVKALDRERKNKY